MSTASIIAFLAFLSAFNVPTTTVQQVSDILYASQPQTTHVVATTTLQSTPQGDTTLSTTPSPEPAPAPTFSATIPVMEDQSAITVNTNEQNGAYAFIVRVLDKDGKPIENASVHVDAPDAAEQHPWNATITTGARIGPSAGPGWDTDWQNWFNYTPTTKGDQTIMFTSGNLTKTITINVQ